MPKDVAKHIKSWFTNGGLGYEPELSVSLTKMSLGDILNFSQKVNGGMLESGWRHVTNLKQKTYLAPIAELANMSSTTSAGPQAYVATSGGCMRHG